MARAMLPFVAVAALAPTVLAGPCRPVDACHAVADLVQLIRNDAYGAEFCQDLLGIVSSTDTLTATSTPATVTVDHSSTSIETDHLTSTKRSVSTDLSKSTTHTTTTQTDTSLSTFTPKTSTTTTTTGTETTTTTSSLTETDSTTITVTSSFSTVTTSTEYDTKSSTITDTVSSTTTTTTTTSSGFNGYIPAPGRRWLAGFGPREVEPRRPMATPGNLIGYPAADLRLACKCINMGAPTYTTVTTTVLPTQTATSEVDVSSKTTVVSTELDVSTLHSTTVDSTSTTTTTTTTSSTSTAPTSTSTFTSSATVTETSTSTGLSTVTSTATSTSDVTSTSTTISTSFIHVSSTTTTSDISTKTQTSHITCETGQNFIDEDLGDWTKAPYGGGAFYASCPDAADCLNIYSTPNHYFYIDQGFTAIPGQTYVVSFTYRASIYNPNGAVFGCVIVDNDNDDQITPLAESSNGQNSQYYLLQASFTAENPNLSIYCGVRTPDHTFRNGWFYVTDIEVQEVICTDS
ncbi:hypothetical protein SEUCBS139899_000871 [Sporothrix eucalyptigena]|uniref:Uncharacterized protein n=1 Tax=Sporothrix eucalyptigena TaxID=1812306 RepID=A0ABP0BZ70_9PEZI